jgi:hypothetical protein
LKQVDEVLDFAAVVLSLAGKQVMLDFVIAFVCAESCAGDNQAIVGIEDTEYSCRHSHHVLVRILGCTLEATEVRPVVQTSMEKALTAQRAAAEGLTPLLSSKYVTL